MNQERTRYKRGALPAIARGIRGALPIGLGYFPIGMAYGLLAQQTGLSVWAVAGFSLFVFAGASQIMVLPLIAAGASIWSIVGATFIVNLRHLLMSASLSPSLSSWSRTQRVLLAATLTDESFGAQSARAAEGSLDPDEALALNATAYIAWTLSSVIGFTLGLLIRDARAWGLDFALPAMFIGLLTPLCHARPALTAALCGAGVSTALFRAGFGSGAVIVGALIGATAGLFVTELVPEGGKSHDA
ncbi:MAG: AzlC family ABC transporter permease [Fretibacterium sp.]|nr:AzlC family ABC transporter permease [Fretibacterium sp.]